VDFWKYGLKQDETNSIFIKEGRKWLEQEIDLHIKVTTKTSETLRNAMHFRYTYTAGSLLFGGFGTVSEWHTWSRALETQLVYFFNRPIDNLGRN